MYRKLITSSGRVFCTRLHARRHNSIPQCKHVLGYRPTFVRRLNSHRNTSVHSIASLTCMAVDFFSLLVLASWWCRPTGRLSTSVILVIEIILVIITVSFCLIISVII